jgi:hypothetical protein
LYPDPAQRPLKPASGKMMQVAPGMILNATPRLIELTMMRVIARVQLNAYSASGAFVKTLTNFGAAAA